MLPKSQFMWQIYLKEHDFVNACEMQNLQGTWKFPCSSHATLGKVHGNFHVPWKFPCTCHMFRCKVNGNFHVPCHMFHCKVHGNCDETYSLCFPLSGETP